MKKLFLFWLFATLLTAEGVAQIPYTIRFKNNDGTPITSGNTQSYLSSASSTSFTQTTNGNAANQRWYFIPVGDESTDVEPGWYYIKNASTNVYLSSSDNSGEQLLVSTTNADERFKWRLIKVNVPTDVTPQAARHFKLVPKTANFVLHRTDNSTFVYLNETYNTDNSVVEIAQVGNNVVFNEDMELVSNYLPIAADADNWDAVDALLLTTPNFLIDFCSNDVSESSNFSPVGYTTDAGSTGVIRYIHDHEASGGNDGDGYYFARLYSGAILNMKLMNPAITDATSDLVVGFWVRAQTTGKSTSGLTQQTYGSRTGYKVGEVVIGEDAYHTYPILLKNMDDVGTPTGATDLWIYYTFTIPGGNLAGHTIPATATVQIKNNTLYVTGTDNRLDIDNFSIAVKSYDDGRPFYNHAYNGNDMATNTPQKVHSLTELVYMKPEETRPMNAASSQYQYYRWHVGGELDDVIVRTKVSGGADANALSHYGKFFWGNKVNGYSCNITAPSNFTEDPFTVTCDASTYNNYDITADKIQEPTLSFRHNFEIHPAWEIAKEINDALLAKHVFEEVNVTAPVGGTANTTTYITSAGTNTRLRIGPKYGVQNYWFLNDKTINTYTDQQIINSTGVNMLHGAYFLWVKSTDTIANSNPTLTLALSGSGANNANNIILAPATPSSVSLIRSRTGNGTNFDTQPANPYYFPLGSLTTKPYLQINTADKTLGSKEYYDVYVMDNAAVASRVVKKVARFTVNYVPQIEPKLPATTPTKLKAYGPISSQTDLLNDVQNKKLIAELNFDQPGEGSVYGLGKTPLDSAQSNYGFVDPTLMIGNGTVATALGAHPYDTPFAFWSEYSFPQAVRAGITGGTTRDNGYPSGALYYHWYYAEGTNSTASVYDRTFYNTGGNPNSLRAAPLVANDPDLVIGNMMFVDAAEIQGTIASLEINEAMCPGTELYFSAYIVNLHTGSAGSAEGTTSGANCRPNLIFILKDKGTGNEVTRFYTGDIGRNAAGVWFQIAFNFTIPNEYLNGGNVNFVLEIKNNGLNTSGNDFAIDEIKIYRSNPSVIAVRTNTLFCKPDGILVASEPLNMKVDIDMTQLENVGKGVPDNHSLFFRFLDGEGTTFPDYAAGTTEIYHGQGVETVNDYRFSYGSIDLDSITVVSGTDTLYYKGNDEVTNRDIMLVKVGNVDHLVFMQSIPPSVLDGDGGMGAYSIYVAEAASTLLTPKCSGECHFIVKYDGMDFSANAEGTTQPYAPSDLVICTNRLAEINASTKEAITNDEISTYYDWYFGPLNTYLTEDEEELEGIEYDQDLNHIGYNQRCFVMDGENGEITACPNTPLPLTATQIQARIAAFEAEGTYTLPQPEDFPIGDLYPTEADSVHAYNDSLNVYYQHRTAFIFAEYQSALDAYETHHEDHPGHYSVKQDVIALRHYYRYVSEEGKVPAESDIATNTDHFPVEGQTGFAQVSGGDPMAAGEFGIANLADLRALLRRIKYYTEEGILTLHQQKIAVAFGSLVPYFYTVVPINVGTKAGATEGAPPIPVELCPTPTEMRIRASNWGPEVEFGKVDDYGKPAKVYRNIDHPEYVYTVRLPQKDREGTEVTQFVVPLLYLDESYITKVELIEIDGKPIDGEGLEAGGAFPDWDAIPGKKISDVHFGVIDPANPKYELVKNDSVTITRMYDPVNSLNGYQILDTEQRLETYWGLDELLNELGERNHRRILEAYPLLYSSYHYYNPDADENHTLFDEGHPYPLGTVLTGGEGTGTGAVTDTLKNNDIGLEIKAAHLPAIARKGDNYFKPGSEYIFRLMCTAEEKWVDTDIEICDKGYYFRMKVVPDTVYWDGTGTNESWHNDLNWKFQQAPATLAPAFSPLKETNVVLKSGANFYPILSNDSIVTAIVSEKESTIVPNEAKETHFIEYDYNFEPNVVSIIHFKHGAELGNQYYLDYDSAKVDLEVTPMKWYGLSAPLRQMYSGDYMFERANPLTEMKLYNTINPQTHLPTIDWTTSFNTTTQLLSAGLAYSLRVGSVYYTMFNDEGDGDRSAVPGSKYNLATTPQKFYFPQHKMSFQLYNEINKKPLAGRIETILPGGRDFGGRFIYETTVDEKSVAPSNPNKEEDPHTVLVEIPTKVTGADKLIVVGNPFMAHIDFAEFYKANSDIITPGFKIFNGTSYLSYFAVNFGTNFAGEIDRITSVDDDNLTQTSIAPMQTFLVTTKTGYSGTPSKLVITKEMNYVEPPSSISSTEMRSTSKASPSVLRIKASRDSLTTYAAIALSEQVDNGYVLGEDSRRVFVDNVKNVPNIFTITDGMYLDINRLSEMPEALPIGITTTGLGSTTITISGLDNLDDTRGYYFKDTRAAPQLFSLADGNEFAYTFDNTEGDQIGRFYIVYEQSTGIDNNNIKRGNIQIYTHQGVVHVLTSNGDNLNSIEICSVDGLKIYQQTNIESSHISIPMRQLSNPVLIVRVSTAETMQVSKIIVTH